MAYPAPVEALVEAFSDLPGIGRVSAERLTFHVLRDPGTLSLARAIERALSEACRCESCGNLCEGALCSVCSDPKRNKGLLAVVEEPRHVEAIERAGVFEGQYHVLMGALNPAEGTDPKHLAVEALVRRLGAEPIRELILATDPDREGEATALLVLEAVQALGRTDLIVTRLARGLPAGSAIEYLHSGVLEDALAERRPVRLRTPDA